MTRDELKRRHAALAELERIKQAHIPQCLQVRLCAPSDSPALIVEAVDNAPHCTEVQTIARACFADRIAEGLAEYRKRLAAIADGEA